MLLNLVVFLCFEIESDYSLSFLVRALKHWLLVKKERYRLLGFQIVLLLQQSQLSQCSQVASESRMEQKHLENILLCLSNW